MPEGGRLEIAAPAGQELVIIEAQYGPADGSKPLDYTQPAEFLDTLPGFAIEHVLQADASVNGSWIRMAKDPKGRLLLGGQNGQPITRVTVSEGKVVKQEVLSIPVSEAMGMLFVNDALYISGSGSRGFALYRCRDTKGNDSYDDVEFLREWRGGGGEHGSHGLVLGPDNMLYAVCGNFTGLPQDLTDSSPHRNYADDLALPRMEDGNGYGAGAKPPGGYIARMPLNLTDAVIGDDGALYFTIGGRGTQASLFRVAWRGSAPAAPLPAEKLADQTSRDARALRHKLESFNVRPDPAAVSFAWPHLNSSDRYIRYAARMAVERNPVSEWQAKALSEKSPAAAFTALLALARLGSADVQPAILKSQCNFCWLQNSGRTNHLHRESAESEVRLEHRPAPQLSRLVERACLHYRQQRSHQVVQRCRDSVQQRRQLRKLVQEWTTADLQPLLGQVSKGRNFQRGRDVFHQAQCSACHRYGDRGGAVGPDLTAVAARFKRQDLLESSTEPSKVLSEQYINTAIETKAGQVVIGRIVEESEEQVVLRPNPLAPETVTVRKADIETRELSKTSPMPAGLLNTFTKEEILDLLAYLESPGDSKHPNFLP